MKANEFVKKFGWEEAKIICNGVFTGVVCYKWVELNIDDLKRLVESHELVESYGGMDRIKEDTSDLEDWEESSSLWREVEKAIADVESCQ